MAPGSQGDRYAGIFSMREAAIGSIAMIRPLLAANVLATALLLAGCGEQGGASIPASQPVDDPPSRSTDGGTTSPSRGIQPSIPPTTPGPGTPPGQPTPSPTPTPTPGSGTSTR